MEIEVGRKAVERHSVEKKSWVIRRGPYMFHVEKSSRDINASVYAKVV